MVYLRPVASPPCDIESIPAAFVGPAGILLLGFFVATAPFVPYFSLLE